MRFLRNLRVPLALSAFDELRSPEIGSILGIPEGTVRTRLQRARQILDRNSSPSRSRTMREEDNMDRMLELSLSSYGEAGTDLGAEPGLAERILARVASDQNSDRSAPKWLSRFLLWAALPAAACLLLTFLLLRSAGPGATHQSASLPQPASTSTGSKAPKVANGKPAQMPPLTAKHHAQTPAAHHCCQVSCPAQARCVPSPPTALA